MQAAFHPLYFGALSVALMATPASASILDDFNSATLITDFQFDDALGTAIESTANTADPAAPFDSDADFSAAATNGLGQFDGSGKDNTAFGSVYSDITGISSGRVLAYYDVTWAFDEQVFDGSQDEEFRLSLVTNDPRSTFITGETFFTRTSATEVELRGNAVGTGSVDTPTVTLGSSGSLLTILEVDLDAETIELWYSADGGVSFLSTGAGSIEPTRGVESVRLVLNEDFSDDRLLIERFAVAVIPEPTSLVVLSLGCLVSACRRKPAR
ncbi:hypothetical protein MalM25_22740 [Planctomycetes bacterium MalM25]|nr:hypothetical protein MalM25_22740 [Planctomycetes bacterium MalM25]